MTKLLLAAGAALLIAGPVFAAETQSEAPAQTVSARGVDFNNKEQVRQFYVKLHAAAQAVCDGGSSTPRASAVDAGCVRQVVADAVKAADKPVLTAMYNTSVDSNRAFAGNDQ
ncbi:MAG: UrcA family protein [Caulobacteraceae bacterium]